MAELVLTIFYEFHINVRRGVAFQRECENFIKIFMFFNCHKFFETVFLGKSEFDYFKAYIAA